jgi:hypothetical protein
VGVPSFLLWQPFVLRQLFLNNSFRLDEVLHSSEYNFEAVALRPGNKLQVHIVISMRFVAKYLGKAI